MKFWDEHTSLRVWLILISFAVGMASVFIGLSFKAQLLGVGIMIIGLAALLFALWLYNEPFTDKKKKM